MRLLLRGFARLAPRPLQLIRLCWGSLALFGMLGTACLTAQASLRPWPPTFSTSRNLPT
ncbi:uncharacterized protein BDV14DRAFT_171105 [Aspergillus stella-maris]|uniref:uncharacterized protein n=1 Tax=Aspergillus stella-maris TaxID=1810926 RepID=UPI003CCE5024